MRGLGDGARVPRPGSVIRRVTAGVALSGFVVLMSAGPIWADSATGSDNATVSGATAVPGPELLGIPLLTLAWAISGVLAVVIGLLVASRRVTQRTAAGPALAPADRAEPAPNRDRR